MAHQATSVSGGLTDFSHGGTHIALAGKKLNGCDYDFAFRFRFSLLLCTTICSGLGLVYEFCHSGFPMLYGKTEPATLMIQFIEIQSNSFSALAKIT
jgi:hypothetical protein